MPAKKTDWLDIIEKNREDIEDALKNAYRTACGHIAVLYGFSSGEECVIINSAGNIRQISKQGTETPEDIQKEEAIYIGCFEWFNPWKFESNPSESILPELTRDETKKYLEFLRNKGWRNIINELTLYDFSPDLYRRVTESFVQEFINTNENEVVDTAIEQCISELEYGLSISKLW